MLIPPSVDDAIDFKLDASEADNPQLAIVFSIIDTFDIYIVENSGRYRKRNTMLGQIRRSFGIVPFKLNRSD
jgi:hypothetical protein